MSHTSDQRPQTSFHTLHKSHISHNLILHTTHLRPHKPHIPHATHVSHQTHITHHTGLTLRIQNTSQPYIRQTSHHHTSHKFTPHISQDILYNTCFIHLMNHSTPPHIPLSLYTSYQTPLHIPCTSLHIFRSISFTLYTLYTTYYSHILYMPHLRHITHLTFHPIVKHTHRYTSRALKEGGGTSLPLSKNP